MITLHFHLQPQYKYELFHINFTYIFVLVSYKMNLANHSEFLFRFLRNETVSFSVQGWTIYIVEVIRGKSEESIRGKFVHVNAAAKFPPKFGIAQCNISIVVLYDMGNNNRNSRFSLSYYTRKLWTGLHRIVIVRRKYISKWRHRHTTCLFPNAMFQDY